MADSINNNKNKKPETKKGVRIKEESISSEPAILDANTFTHGGVPKAKFAPKVPSKRQKKSAPVKIEAQENGEAGLSNELLRLVKQSKEEQGRRGFSNDRTSKPMQVAFGFGGNSSTVKTSGFSKGGPSGSLKKTNYAFMQDGNEEKPSTNKKKNNVEPFDYTKYYPVTLPLRKPFSGDTEELDEDEFGQSAVDEFDENFTTVPAEELDLWTESNEDKILFFQLPASLPLDKNAPETANTADGKSNNASETFNSQGQGSNSDMGKLPAGLMGKLLVYESGAVKLRLGEIIYDVTPGAECVFAQDVAAVNPVSKQCCFLGNVNKRAIVVPDIDSLLDNALTIE